MFHLFFPQTQGYSLALSCLNQRDYSKGIQHALQYVNARPGDVRVHELLGQLYEGKKDWKKAIESYKLAMQLDPQKTKLGLKGREPLSLYSFTYLRTAAEARRVCL